MPRAFSQFKADITRDKLIWQEHESLFPYVCDTCKQPYMEGGKRWIASHMAKRSHHAHSVECPSCHAGVDPHKRHIPVLSERRTELD